MLPLNYDHIFDSKDEEDRIAWSYDFLHASSVLL